MRAVAPVDWRGGVADCAVSEAGIRIGGKVISGKSVRLGGRGGNEKGGIS